ncbi:MAG: 3-deoxy-D-manno-octulosonic acid kinase [Alcanivoracaceae bacterium]
MMRPEGIVEISQQGHTGWFDPALLSVLSVDIFEPAYWQQRNAVTGTATGRGITWFVRDDERELVLRHYRRGGLFGKLVKDTYLGWRTEQSRAMQEFTLLHRMHRDGLPVPVPVAAHRVRRGPGYGADIIIERIPGARSLMDLLLQSPLAKTGWRDIGATIRRFHDAGIDHTDLNIHNILLDDSGKVWVIDFDKCAVRGDGEWKQGNMARLQRSLAKESTRHGKAIASDGDWVELAKAYASSNQ